MSALVPAAYAGTVSTVTGPTSLTSPAAGATGVDYAGLGFTVSSTGGLGPNGGKVTVVAPAGTVLGLGRVHDDTTNADVGEGSSSGATLTLGIYATVSAGDHLTVRFNGATNPAPGTYAMSLSTTSDPTPVTSSGTYTITAAQAVSTVTGPTSLTSPAAGATGVDYAGLGFTVSSTGGLGPNGGYVTVVAPAGTVLHSGWVHDDTTNADVGDGDSSGATMSLGIYATVNPGDHLTVRFTGVTNPAPGTYAMSVSTTSDPTPVTSSGTYTITAAQAVSGVTGPTSLTSPAAGATGVDYRGLGFTVSST
ncbi:MAG: hypothetical protein LC708_03750, partial [Actinobacteria bacterium]|nr:hypothetical protein [Actinomycetota bacterium]